MLRIEVCLCTHQPRRDVLAVALRALGRQTLDRDAFGVLVIDNASAPALSPHDVELAGARLVREDRLGIAHARARAIRETTAPILVFVDDDNELDENYLARALAILDAAPALGCIGGRLLSASPVPRWLQPLRHYLGIRDDLGDAPFSEVARAGSLAIPIGAGMVARREVCERYLAYAAYYDALGRRGPLGVGSCEDLLLAAQAFDLGLACGYEPGLEIVHHIDPRRFGFRYMLRLLSGQGASEALFIELLGPIRQGVHRDRLRLDGVHDPRIAVCLAAREVGRVTSLARSRRRRPSR